MIYNDGFETDGNLRFKKCPRCGNEEFSENAEYCRICGLPAYNLCEGSPGYDENGNPDGFYTHRNPGNARFCEYCGKPTMLFREKILKPFTEFETAPELDDDSFPFNIDSDFGNIPFG